MQTISIITSAVALTLNIFSLVFIFAYWKGKIDTKMDTLWDVYVTTVLTSTSLRRKHNPSLNFPPEWYDKVKDIPLLELTSQEPGHIGRVAYQLVTRLGVAEIRRAAVANSLDFGETLAEFILSF